MVLERMNTGRRMETVKALISSACALEMACKAWGDHTAEVV